MRPNGPGVNGPGERVRLPWVARPAPCLGNLAAWMRTVRAA
jgi:hypothetical protein